jgi:hypothetical protein
MMCRRYGSWLRRLVSGGVTLLPLEAALMEGFVPGMPREIGEPLAGPLRAANLVQRRRGGVELRSHCMRGLRPDESDLPPLPVKPGEVRLLSVDFRVPGEERTLRANFRAVDRQFFMVDFSDDVRPFGNAVPRVTGVEQSWRSGIVRVRGP